MANFPFIFRPTGGLFGNILQATAAAIGTGGLTIANTATTQGIIPTSFRKLYVDRLFIDALTAAGSAGTVTAQVYKQSGATRTNLTAATSLKNDVITGSVPITLNLAITGNEAARLLQPGDALGVELIASGTVTTQPLCFIGASLSVIGN